VIRAAVSVIVIYRHISYNEDFRANNNHMLTEKANARLCVSSCTVHHHHHHHHHLIRKAKLVAERNNVKRLKKN